MADFLCTRGHRRIGYQFQLIGHRTHQVHQFVVNGLVHFRVGAEMVCVCRIKEKKNTISNCMSYTVIEATSGGDMNSLTCNSSVIECLIQLLEQFLISFLVGRQDDALQSFSVCLMQTTFDTDRHRCTENLLQFFATANVCDVLLDHMICDRDLLCDVRLDLCFDAFQFAGHNWQHVLLYFGNDHARQLIAHGLRYCTCHAIT